jgi:hemophore (heme-binding protein)
LVAREGASGEAGADPAPRPPNCSAADVAGVAAGVATALSTYLFTHPDVNGVYTGLQVNPSIRSVPRCKTNSAPTRRNKRSWKASASR